MGRRVARLTPEVLADLPAEVRQDLTWELSPVERAGLHGEAAAAAKQEWIERVLREWGSCGRVLYVDEVAAGFVLYAPPAFFAGTAVLPTAPLDEDTVQLATAGVFAPYAGGGLGRVLVQLMVKDLLTRGGVRAVECIGARGRRVTGSGTPSVLPVGSLQEVGFTTHRPHPAYPRMRMDLRSVVTWRTDLGIAVGRLVDAVRPRLPRPAPAPRVAVASQAPRRDRSVTGSAAPTA